MDLEREVHRLIEQKRRTDLHIVDLEARIHAAETSLLRETAHFGPIIDGLDSYLAAVTGSAGSDGNRNSGAAVARKMREPLKESDRHFSRTSASHPRALAVHSRLVKEGNLSPIHVPGGRAADHQSRSPGHGRSSSPSRHPSGSANSRKKRRPKSHDDPAWTTPR